MSDVNEMVREYRERLVQLADIAGVEAGQDELMRAAEAGQLVARKPLKAFGVTYAPGEPIELDPRSNMLGPGMDFVTTAARWNATQAYHAARKHDRDVVIPAEQKHSRAVAAAAQAQARVSDLQAQLSAARAALKAAETLQKQKADALTAAIRGAP